MKKSIYLLSVIFTIIVAMGCGSKFNPGRNTATAREAIARSDYNAALSALDETKSELTDSTASPSVLTETAVLYCVIDEKLNTTDNIDKAIDCYRLALSINADSVNNSFATLSPDEKCYADLLDKLLKAHHDVSEHPEPVDGEYSVDEVEGDVGDMQIINDMDIIE